MPATNVINEKIRRDLISLFIPPDGGVSDVTSSSVPVLTGGVRVCRGEKRGWCVNCDGVNGYINVGDIGNVKSIMVFMKTQEATDDLFELITNTVYVRSVASVLTATGFTGSVLYVDGLAGTTITTGRLQSFCVTSTANVAAANTVIGLANGGYFNGDIYGVVVGTETWTAIEVARIYAELANWNLISNKTWGQSLARPRPGRCGNQVSAWCCSPYQDTWYDACGVGTATLSGQLFTDTVFPLGDAVYFDGATVGTIGDISNYKVSTFTVNAFIVADSAPAVAAPIFSLGTDHFSVGYDNNLCLYLKYVDASAVTKTLLSNTNAVGVGKPQMYTWRVFVTGNQVEVLFYIDGVFNQYRTNNDGWSAVYGTVAQIGRDSAVGGNYLNGKILLLEFFNDNKSQSWIENRYGVLTRPAIYYKTDFGVPAMNSDIGGTAESGLLDTGWKMGDATALVRFRSVFDQNEFRKELYWTNNGMVYLPTTAMKICNTVAGTGSWSFRVKKQDASDLNVYFMSGSIDVTTQNGYVLRWASDEYIYLIRVDAGAETVLSTSVNTYDYRSYHTVQVYRRNMDYQWTVLVDGVHIFSVQDDDHTYFDYLILDFDDNDSIIWGCSCGCACGFRKGLYGDIYSPS